MKSDQAKEICQIVKHHASLEIDVTHGRVGFGQRFVAAAIDDMAGIWPLLHTACFENEVVGPRFWPYRV